MTARLKRKVAAVVIFSVLYFAFYGFNNYDEGDDDWYIHKLEHPLPKLEAEVPINAKKRNIQFKSVR